MESDDALYQAWTGGDARAGGRLVDRYVAAMMRFFTTKVAATVDADDLAAQVFEVCARQLGRCRGEFRPYLYGVARNVLREYVRRKHKLDHEVDFQTTAAAAGPSPSAAFAQREEQQLLVHALRSVPLDYQIILELSFVEDLSRQQIADALEIPAGTVASRLRRGRELLQAQLTELARTPAVLRSTVEGLESWARDLRDRMGC